MELKETRYSMMEWKLKEGKETLCKIEDVPGKVTLGSEICIGEEMELCRDTAESAEKQLGV